MNRRDSLKKIMLASGSLIALPAWADGWRAVDVTAHHSSFSLDAQQTLASVADTIIPAGNSVGALTVEVDKFLQKLIDNCYEKDVRENVQTQLTSLETRAQALHGKGFSACDQLQREQMLLDLSTSETKEDQDFFKLMKSETIRGFNTSREVMVNHLKYKQVPGHYYGCVDVNT
jgi:hypothetical protein